MYLSYLQNETMIINISLDLDFLIIIFNYLLLKMISIEDMTSKFQIARENYNIPDMIIDGIDYLELFNEYNSLEELMEDYRIDHFGDKLKIPVTNIVYYYFYVKKIITDEDEEYVEKHFPDMSVSIINEEKKRISRSAELFSNLASLYDEINNEIEDLDVIPYNIIEVSKTKTFFMRSAKDDHLLDLADIEDIFHGLEPTSFIQMIVHCNSLGKLTYKVSTEYPIRFIDEMVGLTFEPNTISLFYDVAKESGANFKQTVLNFEKSICSIEIFAGSQYDSTEYFVTKTCSSLIHFEANNSFDVISGDIQFMITEDISFLKLYESMILDPIISYLFKLDERKKPLCISPNEFKVTYYDPMTYSLIYFIGNRVYPSVSLTFKNQGKIKNKYVISFKATNTQIISSMIVNLSKVLSAFTNGIVDDSFGYSSKFYTTVHHELKEKVGFLLGTTDSSESGSYSSACGAERQPILISEEEIDDYKAYGRDVEGLEHDSKVYWFTCISENNPHIEFPPVKAEYKSGIKNYPCCYEKKGYVASRKTSVIKVTGIAGTTSSIKDFSKTSILDQDSLSDFIKICFTKSGNVGVELVGTCFYKTTGDRRSLNDSFIGALIFASEQYNVYADSNKKLIDQNKVNMAVIDVRRRMLELPFEIYKQELYDVTYDEFVSRITDMNHYIDPYLYYRGLEEIFNVNIFVFTSTLVKLNPSSLEELESDIPTLEIPRCHEYHTRTRNDRGIVCIYKNYGSERSLGKHKTHGGERSLGKQKNVYPSCELIALKNSSGKDNLISIVSSVNKRYADGIWNHFYRCCTPIMFQLRNGEIECYEDPYTKYGNIGAQLGMELRGQEIDIHGKTRLLIFDSLNIQVPGIQPLMITKDIPGPSPNFLEKESYIDYENVDDYHEYGGFSFKITSNGTKERAELPEKTELLQVFDATEIDDDGIWMEFAGNPKGIKILCKDDSRLKTREHRSVNSIITEENNVSALLQLINWLWTSEYNGQDLPIFREWFPEVVNLVDYFAVAENPLKCLNNVYLPTFETFEQRMEYCNQIWPFFFSDNKVNLYDKLYIRIMNLMNIQDFQTRSMPFDTFYHKIPRFITNLIPTDEDFERKGSLIFTKKEHMEKWIRYTNRSIFGSVSLTNMKIVNTLIFEEFYSTTVPFIFNNRNEPELDKIYIVQNVSNGERFQNTEKTSAIEIAYRWRNGDGNIGPGIKRQTFPNKTRYVVYEVKNEKQLVPVEDHSEGGTDYFRIVKYKKGNYGALLELL